MATRPESGLAAIRKTLKALALALPDVETGIACAGTALESTTYNARKKAFLFVGPKDARLKRASGWVKIDLAAPPSKKELATWIRESYELIASAPKPATKKRGAKPRNAMSGKSR